jgi:hypothetical protein
MAEAQYRMPFVATGKTPKLDLLAAWESRKIRNSIDSILGLGREA